MIKVFSITTVVSTINLDINICNRITERVYIYIYKRKKNKFVPDAVRHFFISLMDPAGC
jgi:hypothetical protein